MGGERQLMNRAPRMRQMKNQCRNRLSSHISHISARSFISCMLHHVGLADLPAIPQQKRTEQAALGRASPVVVRIRQCLARFANAVSRPPWEKISRVRPWRRLNESSYRLSEPIILVS